ncbi:hypothetical protein PABY_18380 [Pyrodictium abyssi]|uniref:Uncharacterized protein n=1 Tax=Pyrodictium abyssi TaxID=54256 RepID=A0ABN6ZPU9_9CREN|nr:hypothetical protein PABY_18380 [Pyrodictium abyssi]
MLGRLLGYGNRACSEDAESPGPSTPRPTDAQPTPINGELRRPYGPGGWSKRPGHRRGPLLAASL